MVCNSMVHPYSLFTIVLQILITMTSSMIPSLGQGQLYGNCPPGNYADGCLCAKNSEKNIFNCPFTACATLHVCIDPHERCINGICCQPMDNMPFGYGSGFPLPAWHHGPIGSMIGGGPHGSCFDLEESCINFVQHCNVPSVTEVCTHTCGLCHNQPPYVPLPYGGGGGIMAG